MRVLNSVEVGAGGFFHKQIKETGMYGKVLGATNVATGVSLLPETGDSRPLFVAAATLLVSGIAIFVIATVQARKSRQSEAN